MTTTPLALAAALAAQTAPDIGRIAALIRWGGVLVSFAVIAGAFVAIRLVENASERLSERFAHRRPTILLVVSVLRFAIYVVTIAVALSLSIRLDQTAITVIGGALALAVGFAMRDLVAAFIAGLTIMFDRPFQVGDRVQYAGQYGDIIKIGLRSVRMNTLDHNIVTIPNNKILTDVTASGNYGALEMQVPLHFYVGVDQDVRRAVDIVREACLTSPYVFLGRDVPIEAKQVIVHSYIAVELIARAYVFDCKYERWFQTDVHFRVLDAFRANGILLPALLHRGDPLPVIPGKAPAASA